MMIERCIIEKVNFHGWDGITLRNHLISITVVPAIGGRLMAYNLGDYNFSYIDRNLAGKMFTPKEHMGLDGSLIYWKNYGGDKTWPSPQGWSTDEEWHGPPDAILDSGPYSVTALMEHEDGSAEIEMTSLPDTDRTGIQIIRNFRIVPNSTRVQLTLTFRNTSQRNVRWSIWDVHQLSAEQIKEDGSLEMEKGCVITTCINPKSCFERGFHVMFGEENNPQWQVDPDSGLFIAEYLWHIGKVGIDTDCGWIGFANRKRKVALVEKFQFFEGQEYPDHGSSLECWTVGRGEASGLNYEGSNIFLMEAEVLSPLFTFQPHESHSFQMEWGTCCLDGMVKEASEGGLASELLKVDFLDHHTIHLTGKFGVFDPGELHLHLLNSEDEILKELIIEGVTPIQCIDFDQTLCLPDNLSRVELHNYSVTDHTSRLLAKYAIG